MNLEKRLGEAVKQFWQTRAGQRSRQGSSSGQLDQGGRKAVTGGKQLDGFVQLVSELLIEHCPKDIAIHQQKRDVVLPGYFRPTKEWDLVVLHEERLVAAVEFKSQVGSFGNNFNNRVEEALGNATDLNTAFREGAFAPSPAPWVGYLMLLEEAADSTCPLSVREPHFKVFEEWHDRSYAKRYELFCQRLVRERLYSTACFILSNEETGIQGRFKQPSKELKFQAFVGSLLGHVSGVLRSKSL